MGQTRVDLRHLLEDLRDAYPGSIEETILTEIVANSLDSGAIATSTKTRGKGIGFAGVGVKLGLLISREVVTETRTGPVPVATSWSLTGRHKAPWHWLAEPPAFDQCLVAAARGPGPRAPG